MKNYKNNLHLFVIFLFVIELNCDDEVLYYMKKNPVLTSYRSNLLDLIKSPINISNDYDDKNPNSSMYKMFFIISK